MDAAGGASLGRAEGSITLRADGAIAALNRVKAGLREIGGAAQQGVSVARQQLGAFQARIDGLAKSMRSLGQDLTLRLTAPILATGGLMIKWGADLENTLATTEKVFGSAADQVIAFSDTSATAFGIAKNDALDYQIYFAGMLDQVAQGPEELASMSTELTKLTADFGAFFNLNPAESFTILQSAMAGETEAIRRYGVDVSAVAVEQKALELGLAGTTAELTEQDKMLARFHLILEQTAHMEGQFADEADSVSGKLKIQQARLKDVATGFGGLLLPAMSRALDIAHSLIGVLEGLTDTQRRWVIGIAAAAAALGPMLIAVSYMLPALSLFAGMLAAMLSPIGLVVAAAAGLAFLFRDELRAAFDAIVGRITFAINVFQNLRAIGLDPVQAATRTLLTLFPNLTSVILPLAQMVQNLRDAFTAIREGRFGDAFREIGDAIGNVGTAIRNAFELIDWSAIVSLLGDLAGAVAGWLWGQITAVDWPGTIRNAIGWAWDRVVDLGRITVSITSWLVETARDLWGDIKRKVYEWVGGTPAGDGTGGATGPGGGSQDIPIGQLTVTIGSWAVEQLQNLWDAIVDKVKSWVGGGTSSGSGFGGARGGGRGRQGGIPVGQLSVSILGWDVDLNIAALEGAIDRAIRLWEIAGKYEARINEWRAVLEEPSEVDTSQVEDPSLFQRFVEHLKYEVTTEVDFWIELLDAQISNKDSAFQKAGSAVTIWTGTWEMLRGGPIDWEIVLGSPRLGGMGLLPTYFWIQDNIIQPVKDKWEELTGLLDWDFPDISINWPDFSLSIDDVPFYTEIKSVMDQIVAWFKSPWGETPLSIPAPNIDWPDPPEIPEWIKDPAGWIAEQIGGGDKGSGKTVGEGGGQASIPAFENAHDIGGKKYGGGSAEQLMGGGGSFGGSLAGILEEMRSAAESGMENVRSTMQAKGAEWGETLRTGTANLTSIATNAFAGIPAVATPPLAATGAMVASQTAGMLASGVTNFGGLLASAVTNFPGMQAVGSAAAAAMNVSVTGSVNAMRTVSSAAVAGMQAGVAASMLLMRTSATNNATTMQTGVNAASQGMRATSSAAVAGMQAGIAASMLLMRSSATSNAQTMATNVINAARLMGTGAANAVRSGMNQIPSIIASVGAFAASVARGVGAQIGNGVAAGMLSALGTIRAAASAMINEALRAAQARAIISSPSKLFERLVGIFLPQGVAGGIERDTPKVTRASAGMVDAALSPFARMRRSLRDLVDLSGLPGGRVATAGLAGLNSTIPYMGQSSNVTNYFGGKVEIGTVQLMPRPGQDGRALYREFVSEMERDSVSSGGSRRRGW